MFFAVALIILLIIALILKACTTYEFRDMFDAISGVLIALIIINIVVFAVSYLEGLSKNGDLKAFHALVYSTYVSTAEKTEKMVIGNNEKNESLVLRTEYLQQAPEAANRWKELRDKVEWYNTTLTNKRIFWENWFLRQYMVEPPDLPYIILK